MSDAPERIWALADRRKHWQDHAPEEGQHGWHWEEYIRADLVRVTGFEDAPQWLPIETAPKDGTVIWVLMPTALGHGKFSDGAKKAYWMEDLGEWQAEGVGGNIAPGPIGWTPIPKPPT